MKCLICNNHIPNTRKKGAIYCSDVCNYEGRKRRSIQRYAAATGIQKEIKRCENILSRLFEMSELKKDLFAEDLNKLKFNFGIATNEYLHDKKMMFKLIGTYGYCIKADKTLIVWKFK